MVEDFGGVAEVDVGDQELMNESLTTLAFGMRWR